MGTSEIPELGSPGRQKPESEETSDELPPSTRDVYPLALRVPPIGGNGVGENEGRVLGTVFGGEGSGSIFIGRPNKKAF